MQVNSVGAVNFKGDFDNHYESGDFEKYNKAISLTQDFEDKFISTDDIKSPGAVTASVAAAGGKTFLKTAATTFAIDKLTGGKVSGLFETGLKKGSKLVSGFGDKLIKSEGKKLSKVANFIGDAIKKSEGALRTAYKKISSSAKETIGRSPAKGLAIVAGIASVLAFIPAICKRDNNGDGIADLVQRSQSAYDKNSQKCSKVMEGASYISEVATLLS